MALTPSLSIYFYSMDGLGHLNACLGMAQQLSKRGHQVSILLNESFKGGFAKFGFEEILLKNSSTPKSTQKLSQAESKVLVKQNAENLRSAGFLGPGTTLEKMIYQMSLPGENEFIFSFYKSLLEFNPQIEKFLKQGRPDVIIVDTFLVPPAIQKAGIPWVFLCSCNPLAILKSPKLPPHASGYPTVADPSTWSTYRALFSSYKYKLFSRYQEMLDAAFGFEPKIPLIDNDILFVQSPFLNIYGFPRELDYQDIAPLPVNFAVVDAFIRDEVVEAFELPKEFLERPGTHLVYLSLGSMGSIDIELMQRILDVLAKTPYKYIVSKGQRADEYDLPENCFGQAFLPQTRILPMVDLVITHGGNNTVTEAFVHGKPMIVMPMFGDQPDNAQRVMEKGFGVRLDPYEFEDHELVEALDCLLNDEQLKARLEAAKKRIESENSKEKVCQKMERMVENYKRGKATLGG